jgi:hypothetical protein
VAGIGVGTLIGRPLAHELIATIGWRKTYLVLPASRRSAPWSRAS